MPPTKQELLSEAQQYSEAADRLQQKIEAGKISMGPYVDRDGEGHSVVPQAFEALGALIDHARNLKDQANQQS